MLEYLLSYCVAVDTIVMRDTFIVVHRVVALDLLPPASNFLLP